MRRCRGIWPPSKPGRREKPLRDFWPLFPAPAVLPSLEPIPRPTRTLRWREPRGGRKLDRFTAIFASSAASCHDLDQVANLVHHATNGGSILALYDLVQFAQTQAANGLPHVPRAPDGAAHPLDSELACLGPGHVRQRLRPSAAALRAAWTAS